jgi:cytochrome o ubiquinol oxidase operon protein cyoD
MTHVDRDDDVELGSEDTAPGDEYHEVATIGRGLRGYVLGLALAVILTVAAFWAPTTHLVYRPAIPALLVTLAVAQMGVHLVFFLHLTSGPDSTNTILALAFGVLTAGLILAGSIWIMDHLNQMMPSMSAVMAAQR